MYVYSKAEFCRTTSDGQWQPFMRQFANSIRHIVHDIDKSISIDGDHPIVEDELESLRSKVDELTEEVSSFWGK